MVQIPYVGGQFQPPQVAYCPCALGGIRLPFPDGVVALAS